MKIVNKINEDNREDDWLKGWWAIGVGDGVRQCFFFPSEPTDVAYMVIRVGDLYRLIEDEWEFLEVRDSATFAPVRNTLDFIHERITNNDMREWIKEHQQHVEVPRE